MAPWGGGSVNSVPISEQGRPRVAGSNSSEVTLTMVCQLGTISPLPQGTLVNVWLGDVFGCHICREEGGSCPVVGGGQGSCWLPTAEWSRPTRQQCPG